MTEHAHNGDVTIAYERLGPPDGEPLLLVASPGTQLTIYPGTGAGLPRPLWSDIADEIGALAATVRTA